MLFKKKNQMKDERIQKESNKAMVPMFYITSVEFLILLIVKLVLKEPVQNYILDILCLVPAWVYVLVRKASNGLLLVKEKDDELRTFNNEILAKGYMVTFWFLILGELIYFYLVVGYKHMEEFVWPRELTWVIMYIVAWFIPALVYTVMAIKKGWIIWGTKKREVTGKKQLAKSTALGALFFGIVMGLPDMFKGGSFHPEAIWTMLAMGATWGLLFFIMFAGVMKIAEKNADKVVKEKEKAEENTVE